MYGPSSLTVPRTSLPKLPAPRKRTTFPKHRRTCLSLVQGPLVGNEKKWTVSPYVYVRGLKGTPKVKLTLPNRPYAGTRGESSLGMSNIPAADVRSASFLALFPPAYMFGHEIGLLACSFQRDRDVHGGLLEHEPASPEKLGSETASLLPRKKNKTKPKPKSFGQQTSAAASHVSVNRESGPETLPGPLQGST